MFIVYWISIFFIIINFSYGQSDSNQCVIIYIPEERLIKSPNNYDMLLFATGSNSSMLTKSISDVPGRYNAHINYGKFIYFNEDNYHALRINLDDTEHKICDNKYNDRELKVTNKTRTDDIFGYVYRHTSLTLENYNSFSEDELHSLARSLVVRNGNNHEKRRSKYLAICISGDNNYANYRCYGLPEDKARLAYLSKPYTLIASNRKIINCDLNWTWWKISQTSYYIINPHPYDAEEDSSTCYFQYRDGARSASANGGRIFFVSDEVYDNVGSKTGNQSKNIIKRSIGNIEELYSCYV